jgi:hypothetical protein
VPEAQIMAQTGLRPLPVLHNYAQHSSLLAGNAAGKIGL